MIKYLSLFSGIGAFESALRRLNISFELINYCEIDKFASKSYSGIHNISEEKNLGDITKINYNKLNVNIDLITYGFLVRIYLLQENKKVYLMITEVLQGQVYFLKL